jgi:hypothetical protein
MICWSELTSDRFAPVTSWTMDKKKTKKQPAEAILAQRQVLVVENNVEK